MCKQRKECKKTYYLKLANQIKSKNLSQKEWWSLLKRVSNIKKLKKSSYPPIDRIVISSQDVKDTLQMLNTSKATGPDNLNPMLLKQASSELTYPLTKLFNLSLQNSSFPSLWKTSNVVPVFKKGSANIASNYRPISLLSVLGECMERCIFKHIYNYLHSKNILIPQQSGFRPNTPQ